MKTFKNGYAGHRPAPNPYARLRSDPLHDGQHALPDPHWPNAFASELMGYSGRPGFVPKGWSASPPQATCFNRSSSVPAPSLPGHPALTSVLDKHAFFKDDGFRRSVHGMPGYAGHRAARWHPAKPDGLRPTRFVATRSLSAGGGLDQLTR
eukprot:CAMPEP_0179106088 /NCGR_PEP_ID=MMETSP0796-20121207/49303_1 /TAXON_ID=73915 /ORGANISM="Pyrodinium bahamense, Strain pbaha01" /LENGTH=150 /DNA_ID=CAMNT_0020804095 /DNA_START=32 /DNA_END=484 /DNA_ORIENTATION=-